jgi:hypothetical protein
MSKRNIQTSDLPNSVALTTGVNTYTSSQKFKAGPHIDVTSIGYGADPTGATDAGAVIKQAINDAASVLVIAKRVYIPAGIYMIATEIVPQNGVTVFGDGGGKTILRPSGTSAAFDASGVSSSGSPLTDFILDSVEIDGTNQNDAGTYSVNIKGTNISYATRYKITNCYIHDTIATGIGFDYLGSGCVVENNVLNNCGRGNGGTNIGGAGIGVGLAGTTDDEPARIAFNHVTNCARYGIFIEAEAGSNGTDSRSYLILGNWCKGNQHGIGLNGGRWSICSNNHCTNNTVSGIAINQATTSSSRADYEGIVANNICEYNAQGIIIDYTSSNSPVGNMTIHGNTIGYNTGNGIQVRFDTLTVYGLKITENVIEFNALSGIRGYYNGVTNNAVLRSTEISRNVIRSNGTSASTNDKSGIRFEIPLTRDSICDNFSTNEQSSNSQDYGILIAATATITACVIKDNRLGGNVSGGMLVSATIDSLSMLSGNAAYAPPAAVLVTLSASPYTYTPSTEAPTWLAVSGGTVSSITVAGVQYASATNAVLPIEPGDVVIITYSATPTVVSRKR